MKYLNRISERLNFFKTGLERNMREWTFPENPSLIQSHIDEVEAVNLEIKQLKKTLTEKFTEARLLRDKKKEFLKMLEKRAVGLHADEPGKLADYGIVKNQSSDH